MYFFFMALNFILIKKVKGNFCTAYLNTKRP